MHHLVGGKIEDVAEWTYTIGLWQRYLIMVSNIFYCKNFASEEGSI
jgi:hypothetical protein